MRADGRERELTLAVYVEATLVLSLAVAALAPGTTDLPRMIAGIAGTGLALAAVAFALVAAAIRRRQVPNG